MWVWPLSIVHLSSIVNGNALTCLRIQAISAIVPTDFKRHDLGANFYERNYDGTLQKEFMTRPLLGAGSAAPYGHDGRSINLMDVILRHGGEAREYRDEFARFSAHNQMALIEFLN
ncbi:MAG: hypothetical protein J2P21_32975 [Chloracidobacterium sp.]|nr:hypothetical protein [Chloracidobacterium sp.]